MTPEQWRRIEALFHATRERAEPDRHAFLAEACAGDDIVQREVESLLAEPVSVEGILDRPAVALVRHLVSGSGASVLTGRRIGPYQVQALLGAGGMGEVYRAFDTKLGREVAIKVLPPEFATNPDRFKRFEREARVLASLNHTNIATIHELQEVDGIHFIVMEYVEGETFQAKVTRGPVASSELVKLATQVAEALDAAHSIGIIHRDVKSANIMITPRGHAKVLDFGLAKRITLDEPLSNNSNCEAPRPVAMMGTLPYISPEQALGKRLDQRSDLFSLGVVLYEMATGQVPFSASTPRETIDNIVHGHPTPITSINATISPGLECVILRCLEKQADNRFQTAAELATALRTCHTASRSLGPAEILSNNLPHQLTPFIGRKNQILEIQEIMNHTRLITLTGPAGIGKTRLALQVAAGSGREYDSVVWFVEFASLADPGLVPQTVASCLGVREESGRSIIDTLASYVKGRCLLLVLDNCEHLISACAQLTDTLLRAAPNLRVLATSRESLGITGETVFRVPPLGVPDPEQPLTVENLTGNEAVELFVDRARAVKSTFAITTATAVPLMRLCTRLEGIPLAIELAASRVKVLSIEQIADRLDDPLNLLTGGSRTALPRHQTLLSAIDWSYNLLTEPERILFRRLSVFAGGWTLEAAERVCGGDGVDERSVLELLSGLVDKSLALPEDRNGQQRYRFMVTLLEYAHKRLMQTDEGDTIHRRYAEFFVALATESESKLIGAEQQPWLARLNDEYDNIRTVLTWTSKHDVDMRLGFAGVLGRFWYLRGHLDEGRRWLAEVLATKGSNAQVEHRIKALNAAARIALHQGDCVSVGSFLDQALTLARESDNKRETAEALNMLAILASEQDDFAAARSYLEETLSIRRQLGDKGWMALALNNLGVVAIRQADFSSALSRLDEALSLSREAGDPHGTATAIGNRAEVARRLGDYAMAKSLRAQGLAIAQDFGDKTVMVPAFGGLGNLARQQGDYARARLLLDQGLKLSRELGNKTAIADALQSLGLVAEDCADDATARSLFEQTVVIRRGLGEKLNIAVALNGLGRVMARVDDAATARSLHEQALDIGTRSGARDCIAQSINGLADLARRQADDALALSHYKQSLALWWELGEAPELPHALENIGTLVAARAQHERAARLWGAAEALRTAIGVPRPPSEADEYQRHVTDVRAAFGKDAFKVAWSQGLSMAPNQAVAYALEEAGR